MLRNAPTICSWGIGLSGEQAALLHECLNDRRHLVFHSGERMADMLALNEEDPCMLWISSKAARTLRHLPAEERRRCARIPKAFLLDEDCGLDDFESVCGFGMMEILRPPYSKERIAEIMSSALDACCVHHDLTCMTREILLERELWERKNELLGFLVNFCATTTERLDLDHILRSAYSGLCRLLPLHSMHLALWEQEDADTAPSVSLYIHASKNSGEYGFWRDTLLDQAGRLLGPRFSLKETRELELDARHVAGSPPQNSSPLVLPVVIGQQRLGSLVLLTGMERHLGRDQALALDSAMRHFALNIKNARRFQRIQMYADYDVLTGVHNRRHCERRIEEELNHVSRYAQPLSLLMLDIDHFKRINDACGHHAGDAVLRQVASLLTRSIRATDYCARYGGEEFIILMPHTGSKKALHLAERIRKIIAAHSFAEDGDEPLRLTVSLGLACMEPDACKSGRQLLKEADAALYAAKADGRNCTRKNAA